MHAADSQNAPSTSAEHVRGRAPQCWHGSLYGGHGEIFPWHDSPPELREIILSKVPLLRLAQMASFGKEFDSAYRQRLADGPTAPWLDDACPVVATWDARDLLLGEAHLREDPRLSSVCATRSQKKVAEYNEVLREWDFGGERKGPRGRIARSPPWQIQTNWETRVSRPVHPLASVAPRPADPTTSSAQLAPRQIAPNQLFDSTLCMSGLYTTDAHNSATYEYFTVHMVMYSDVLEGQGLGLGLAPRGCRTMSGSNVIFRIHAHHPDRSSHLDLANCMMVCTAMAAELPTLLREVARGLPLEASRGSPLEVARGLPLAVARGTPLEVARSSPLEVVRGLPLEVERGVPHEQGQEGPGSPLEVARGMPLEVERGVPRERGGLGQEGRVRQKGQEGRVEPIEQITLVLPEHWHCPNAAVQFAIEDALARMCALSGARPSGLRIAFPTWSPWCNKDEDRLYEITAWRHPCVIGDN